jgi:DNA-binding IclR family transcriptional regulator
MVAAERDRGVAFDYGCETAPEVFCVSAPVYAPSGGVVGAVAAILLDQSRLQPLASAVQWAADMVGRNIAKVGAPNNPALDAWLDGGVAAY